MAEASLTTRVASRDQGEGFWTINRIRIVTIVLIWAAYEGLASSGWFFEGILPSSLTVLAALANAVTQGEFYFHLGVTWTEVLVGFFLGTFIGLATGIIFGSIHFMGRMLNPWVEALAPAPKVIFLPILMLLFGVGMGPKIAMATISAFFPVAIATYAAMSNIRPVYLRVVQTFNASRWQIVRMVYLPALVAPVLTSLRLALGVAYIGALLAEIKLSNMGLGYLIVQHYNFFRIADMYAVLLLTFAMAVVANSLMGWLASRVEHERS